MIKANSQEEPEAKSSYNIKSYLLIPSSIIMQRPLKHLVLLSFFFLLSCEQQNNMDLPTSKTVAVVGDFSVSEDLLKAYMHSNAINPKSQEQVNLALQGLIDEVAMANIAKKKQLKLTPQQLNTLYYLKLKAESQIAQKDYREANPISETDIQNEYEKANQMTGGLEYHVHHMLFEDEVQAISMLEKTSNPEQYLNNEAGYLSDKKSTKNVGDLGWVNLQQLPDSFAEVLLLTEKNSVIPQVLKSRFGAHVVYLKGIRELTPPPLAEVKEGVSRSLKAQKLSRFKQLARAKAKVTIKK